MYMRGGTGFEHLGVGLAIPNPDLMDLGLEFRGEMFS